MAHLVIEAISNGYVVALFGTGDASDFKAFMKTPAEVIGFVAKTMTPPAQGAPVAVPDNVSPLPIEPVASKESPAG